MRSTIVCLASVGLLVGVIGCDRDTETVPDTSTPKSPEAQANDAMKSVTGALEQKSQEMANTAEEAKATAEAGAEKAVADAKTAADSGASEQAQKLLDQAVAYAKENKFDLAEQAIAKAEALPNLPEAIKARIPQVRQSINAMKASGDASGAAKDLGKAVEGLGK